MLFVMKKTRGEERKEVVGERKGRRGVVKCGSFAKKRGGVGSVTAGHAGLGFRLAALSPHRSLFSRVDRATGRPALAGFGGL